MPRWVLKIKDPDACERQTGGDYTRRGHCHVVRVVAKDEKAARQKIGRWLGHWWMDETLTSCGVDT
jgi:hypothetical protein